MNKQGLVLLCAVLFCSALYACGDVEEKPIPWTSVNSTVASSSSGEGGMGGSGMGGMGGMGGMAGAGGMTSSSSSSSTGMGGAGGMAGGGGMGGGSSEPMINGCKQSTADDYTGMNMATIQFVGLSYSPACIRIKAGSSVTFEGSFGAHPLEGGTVENGVPTPDPNSPIAMTNMGMSATFPLNNPGVVPYYCTLHAAANMMGAIFVEP